MAAAAGTPLSLAIQCAILAIGWSVTLSTPARADVSPSGEPDLQPSTVTVEQVEKLATGDAAQLKTLCRSGPPMGGELTLSTARSAPQFVIIGDLPGGANNFSEALAMTPDGEVVVGVGYDDLGDNGFRWVPGQVGPRPVTRLDGGSPPSARATGINTDGRTIVGYSSSLGTIAEACFWRGGVNGIGGLPSSITFSLSTGVSGDGSVICGTSVFQDITRLRAFGYTSGGGLVDLGLPSGYTDAAASGMSRDGSTIVGSVKSATTFQAEPMVWRAGVGMTVLPVLPGAQLPIAEARCVSDDNAVIAGYSYSGRANPEACLWVRSGGVNGSFALLGLGDLPGGNAESYARGVNDDGTVVVGIASTAAPTPLGYEAFYWTAQDGMRRLKDVIEAAGLDTGGWMPIKAQAVSADGSAICGSARSPDNSTTAAFYVRLPTPVRSPDFNRDGVIGVPDIFAFLGGWFALDPRADFDRSGVIEVPDVFAYLGAWFGQ